jgi:uracil-DNA glycosylase family 4
MKSSDDHTAGDEIRNIADSLAYYLEYFDLSSFPGISDRSSHSEERPVAEEQLPSTVFGISYDSLSYVELKNLAMSCSNCALHQNRKNVVFGSGNTDSPLIAFVGEGPGAEEDIQGEPFVGKAGQLLTAAITKGLKMNREDVYICNVVKCRPPENRTPLPEEVSACYGYLKRQLELVSPRVIVTLGAPAQKAILGIDKGISKVRGSWHEWNGVKVMPTFHPAYILRNPPAKKEFWADLQLVMKELGL